MLELIKKSDIIEKIDISHLSLRDAFFESLKGYIINSSITDKKSLKLYPYDITLIYIDQAKELCINEITAFNMAKDFINPKVLFTKKE